jgi:hypothetical protein
MSLQGVVARPHMVEGFSDPTNFYTDVSTIVIPEELTAHVFVTVKEPTVATDEQYAGNLSATGGWSIGRVGSGDPANVTFRFEIFSGGVLEISVDPTEAMDRTFLLSMSTDYSSANCYMNGAFIGKISGSPGITGTFAIGGDTSASKAAAEDRIVFVAVQQALAPDNLAVAEYWAGVRRYSRPLDLTGFVWIANDLSPEDGSIGAPVTWASSGTSVATLSYAGAGNLVFSTAPFAAFTGRASGTGTLSAPLDLYVSELNGNDANSGLTPATALATLGAAVDKIRPFNKLAAPVIIHTGRGFSYRWDQIPDFLAANKDAQVIVWGDGAGQPGEDGFTIVDSGAVNGVATLDTIPYDGIIVPPSLGLWVRFGTEIRMIRTVTPTEITLSAPLSVIPADNTPFDVVAPAQLIDVSGLGRVELLAGSNSCYPTLINFGILSAFSGDKVTISQAACFKMFGVLSAAVAWTFEDAFVYAGTTEANRKLDEDIHLAELWSAIGDHTNDYNGWGLSAVDTLTPGTDLRWKKFTGFIVNPSTWAVIGFFDQSSPDNEVELWGGSAFGGSLFKDGSLSFNSNGGLPMLFADPSFAGLAVFNAKVDVNDDFQSVDFQAGGFGALAAFSGSTVNWVNVLDWTKDVAGVPYFGIYDGSVMTYNAFGGSGTFNLSSGATAYLAQNGSEITFNALFFGGPGPSVFNAADVGGGTCFNAVTGSEIHCLFDVVAAGTTGDKNITVASATAESSIVLGAVTVSEAAVTGAFFMRDQGQIALASVVATASGSLAVCAAQSELAIDSLSGDCDFTAAILTCSAGSEAAVNINGAAFKLTTTGSDGIVSAGDGSQVLVAATDIVTAAAGGQGALVANDGNITASLQNLTGGERGVYASLGGRALVTTSTLTGTTSEAVLATRGGIAILEGLTAINAGTDGISASGGGTVYFDDANLAAAFTVGGVELRVSPTETNTFAVALPSPGDSYSNAGGGVSMTRGVP